MFGPVVAICLPPGSIDDVIKKGLQQAIKLDNELIKKGYGRILEKIKEIRQSFSQAVTNGTRNGSEKIVFEFYNTLVKIWGGSASCHSLSFGVDSSNSDSSSKSMDLPDGDLDILNDDIINDEYNNNNSSGDSSSDTSKNTGCKRKLFDAAPKLIDNKRKHLERTLSASQRDQIFLKEARDDAKFWQDLAEAMKELTLCFSRAMEGVNSAITQIGETLGKSIEMLSHALLQQNNKSTTTIYFILLNIKYMVGRINIDKTSQEIACRTVSKIASNLILAQPVFMKT